MDPLRDTDTGLAQRLKAVPPHLEGTLCWLWKRVTKPAVVQLGQQGRARVVTYGFHRADDSAHGCFPARQLDSIFLPELSRPFFTGQPWGVLLQCDLLSDIWPHALCPWKVPISR